MNIRAWIALGFLALLTLGATLAGVLAPHDPASIDLGQKFLAPSLEYPLGTDHLGRDLFSRLLYGARYSLSTVLCISACIVGISLALGTLCGYRGGWLDTCVMRVCDAMLTFPTIILALFLIGMLGTGLINMITAIVITHLAWYTRFARSLTLGLKNTHYVLAARAMGLSRWAIIRKHLVPSVLIQLLVLSSLDIGHMLLHVAGLSFLGLGLQPPTPEWGVMISDARAFIRTQPQLMFYPGLMIFLTTAAFNYLGDTLRDKFDPALRGECTPSVVTEAGVSA